MTLLPLALCAETLQTTGHWGREPRQQTLGAILRTNRNLDGIPVLANVDFGHTDPLLTLPVGGHTRMAATVGTSELEFSW